MHLTERINCHLFRRGKNASNHFRNTTFELDLFSSYQFTASIVASSSLSINFFKVLFFRTGNPLKARLPPRTPLLIGVFLQVFRMGSEIVQGSPGRTAEAASADNSRAQNTPTTPSVAGRKRSLSPLSATSPAYARTTPATSVTKYYAVRTGRKPGIYYSWNDCRAQVGGFKGARCKSADSSVLVEDWP